MEERKEKREGGKKRLHDQVEGGRTIMMKRRMRTSEVSHRIIRKIISVFGVEIRTAKRLINVQIRISPKQSGMQLKQ